MRKFLLGATIGLTALLLSWDGGVAFHVKQADARLGRPLTPFSVAGVHRRVMRRNFGVGWRGYHPVARAAAVGAVAAGAGYYGGGYYGGGCSCPGAGWGGAVGWGAPGFGGWGSGLGFRPGFGVGAPGFGWHRGWGW
jgi:hypothetical protein